MDLKKYDELRKKISTKDFEGNNSGLDKWLWRFSFVGNASSIFFAYFLVYPALLKAITLNFITGNWGTALAFGLTLIFLVIFEIVKRYLIRNFSNDYMVNKRKLNFKLFGWSITSVAVVALSFYLSISGSKNLASTSSIKNVAVQTQTTSKIDSLTSIYDTQKQIYVDDNEALREVNKELRQTLAETPLNYITARKEYQTSIDKNTTIIQENDDEVARLNAELQIKIAEYNQELSATKSGNASEDSKNILLFVIIVIFNELIIIGGLYFREYYEYKLYQINQQKYEKIYQKKDRYRALLTFVYNDGKLSTGDKVITGLELKEIVAEKTNIQNSNKFVEDFLRDMDRLGIFVTNGKRRYIQATFDNALEIVENYDDAYRVLENLT
jgi:hypothetical protein